MVCEPFSSSSMLILALWSTSTEDTTFGVRVANQTQHELLSSKAAPYPNGWDVSEALSCVLQRFLRESNMVGNYYIHFLPKAYAVCVWFDHNFVFIWFSALIRVILCPLVLWLRSVSLKIYVLLHFSCAASFLSRFSTSVCFVTSFLSGVLCIWLTSH